MTKEKKSLLSDEFLTELAEEINREYGYSEPLTQKVSDVEEASQKSEELQDF